MNMIGFFYLSGQEIKRSPFNVKIGPHKTSKIKAYGPGLKGGIVNKPAKFTVDTCGETGALGFSIEGPSQVLLLKCLARVVAIHEMWGGSLRVAHSLFCPN